MKIEKYLRLYENYRKSFFALKEARENAQKLYAERGALEAWREGFSGMVGTEDYEKDYRRRESIVTHSSARLSAAISRIGDVALQNVLICKYFYNFKISEIAVYFSYCERHVYRLLKEAKKRLEKELLLTMPCPRRGETGKVYRITEKTSRIPKQKGA